MEKEKHCCVCGEEATSHCPYCANGYCEKHYETTVLTGNCCADNERDY